MIARAVTRGIAVSAAPLFIEDESDPDEPRFVWAYTIEIANESETTVQLVARHWIITDKAGVTREVKGAGVVGEQPILKPGDSFTYTSMCPLSTPSGLMRGSFEMVDEAGGSFPIEAPAFSLDSPHDVRTVN